MLYIQYSHIKPSKISRHITKTPILSSKEKDKAFILSMACNVLPQALVVLPRSPFFCSAISQRAGVACTKFHVLSLSGKARNCSFVVRAEEEVAAEVVDESLIESEEVTNPPRQPRVKLGDVMGILNKRAIEESDRTRPIPELRVGDVVEIKLEVPENRRRLSNYKGIIMSKQNAGIHTTIRIRRIIAGVGVEIVFPVSAGISLGLKRAKTEQKRRKGAKQLLPKHQRDSSSQPPESPESKAVLFERQASKALHFQMRDRNNVI